MANEREGKDYLSGSSLPIVSHQDYDAPSVFRPEALLREARRQKQLDTIPVQELCVLDPDGDLVRVLKRGQVGRLHQGWACYHTDLFCFDLDGYGEVGVIGCAVGAPFAVLVADQLFASGWRYPVMILMESELTRSQAVIFVLRTILAPINGHPHHHYLLSILRP